LIPQFLAAFASWACIRIELDAGQVDDVPLEVGLVVRELRARVCEVVIAARLNQTSAPAAAATPQTPATWPGSTHIWY